jgi:hypothetical protein
LPSFFTSTANPGVSCEAIPENALSIWLESSFEDDCAKVEYVVTQNMKRAQIERRNDCANK